MYKVLLFGFLLSVFGIMLLRQYYRDEKCPYDIVYGKIVDSQVSKAYYKGKHSIGYVPVIEYEYNGKTYRRNHRIESSKYGKNMEIIPASKYRIGDEVELRVYIDKPEYALINDKGNIRLPLYVGIPVLLIGVITVIFPIVNL